MLNEVMTFNTIYINTLLLKRLSFTSVSCPLKTKITSSFNFAQENSVTQPFLLISSE